MVGEDRIRLVHMLEAAEAAIRFAAGRDRTQLDWTTVSEELPAILPILRAELARE
jgi:uncharacterized protein with HEPN domain